MIGVVMVTAGVSWVCYRLIERPGIEAGRRLVNRKFDYSRQSPNTAARVPPDRAICAVVRFEVAA